MISDIDKEVKKSIVWCFADDTRLSKMIGSEDDKEKMQEDLKVIYRWAEENLVELT